MKLDIKRFSESFQMDTDALQQTIELLNKIGNASVDCLVQIGNIMNDINGTELLGSATSIINEIISSINAFTGDKFSPAFTGLSNALTSIIGVVSELDIDYGTMIKGWAEEMQSAMGAVSSGLNSTVEKGSYSINSYISDVSNSGKTILKETASIIQKTGDVYKSYTGKTIVESAQGAFKNIMSFATSGGSNVSSLISNIFAS